MDIMLVTHPCFAKEFLNAIRKLKDRKYRIEFSSNLNPLSLSLVKISRDLYFPDPKFRIMLKNDTSHLFTNQTQMTLVLNKPMKDPAVDNRRIIIRCENHTDCIMVKKYRDEDFNAKFNCWTCPCCKGYSNENSSPKEPIYECPISNCNYKVCLLCAYTHCFNPVVKKEYEEGELLPYYNKKVERLDHIAKYKCMSSRLKFYQNYQSDSKCQSLICNDGKAYPCKGFFHVTKDRETVLE